MAACGVRWAGYDVEGGARRDRAPTYCPQILYRYEICRSVQTFKEEVRGLIGSTFFDRALSGRMFWTFEGEIGGLAVDALIHQPSLV